MTQLGLGSYACAWAIGVPGYAPPAHPMDAVGLIEFASELGLKVVQIADNIALHTLTEAERRAIRDAALHHGIHIEVGTRGIQTAHLREYIGIAQFFGSPILRVVIDTRDHQPTPEEVMILVRAALPDLQAAGITLAIENHDRFKARTLAGIIVEINHPNVGICLDTVNSLGAVETLEVVVDALGPYVVNLHVKEFVVRRLSHNLGFEVTGAPAGHGVLDIPWLLNALHGRRFNAIIEAWCPPLATTEETIAQELAWARQSVTYLRKLIAE